MPAATPPPATALRNCRRRTTLFPPMAAFRRCWKNWSPPSGGRKVRPMPGLVLSGHKPPKCNRGYGDGAMKILRLAVTAAALLLSFEATVQAQTTLRIGLAEDPDILDPTLARTYVGRIVFASFCDKLFDIDEKLNIVPQLALSHETSADGKEVTIKLRPNVKFHDGEPLDAEAAKYSIERHLTLGGSFRKPELATVDHVDVVDPLTIKLVLKSPFAPLIAQLTDRAGMMMSPKAVKEQGDKFA